MIQLPKPIFQCSHLPKHAYPKVTGAPKPSRPPANLLLWTLEVSGISKSTSIKAYRVLFSIKDVFGELNLMVPFVIQIIWLLFLVPSVLSHPSWADINDFVLSLCLVPALTLPQAPGSRGLRSTLSISLSPSPSVKLKSQHGTGPLVPSIQAICHILIQFQEYANRIY